MKPTDAQIGDDEPPDLNSVLLGFTNYVNNERVRSYNEGVDDTIERCAQVADNAARLAEQETGDEMEMLANELWALAAAIRALKDKP